jgi:uncharacterized protein YbbC (DUF1343 family)
MVYFISRKIRLICLLVWMTFFCVAFGSADVVLGIDNLFTRHVDLIRGKNVGVIANHTSLDASGTHLVDRIAKEATVVALFGPEHGYQGNVSAGESIRDESHHEINIYSLYGEYRAPTSAMLRGVDVLVYDIQDVGVKFYTYISTLSLSLYAARREQIPIVVLDRPNPIGGDRVEGAVTHPIHSSFVGPMPLPIRYGMTVGELASMMNTEPLLGFAPKADLTVVEMTGYQRAMGFEETQAPWVAPSPNMPSVETALLYPGMCLIEGTNLSEGRGTDAPFLTVGAPYIDAQKWLASIPRSVLAGLEATPVTFTPRPIKGKAENPKFRDKACNGLRFRVIDAEAVRPIELVLVLMRQARELFPGAFKTTHMLDRLWGNEDLRALLDQGAPVAVMTATYAPDITAFKAVRLRYLRYH